MTAVVILVAVAAVTGMILGTTGSPRQASARLRPPGPSSSIATTVKSPSRAKPVPPVPPPSPPVWRVVWGSAMAWGYGVAEDATVRDLVTAAGAGRAMKFRFSNAFGNAPLSIGAATVADSAGGSAVDTGTVRALTFGGAPTTTIPVGEVAYSDPLSGVVTPGQVLAVSIWIRGPDLVSLHPCCGSTSRDWFTPNGRGNETAAPSLAGSAIASPWERIVDAMDVLQTAGQGSIVVVGDSITDGFNASIRWTDVLQSRIDMLPTALRRAVVNEGITANALTSAVHTDALTGGGPSGVSRLPRDALSQPGVSEVVLALGTNDLWFGATAAEVIAGYSRAIAEVHAAGKRIIGMTLLPRSSSTTEYWSPTDQNEMEAVNTWIVDSGAFDGLIDGATAVADIYNRSCDPHAMFGPFDSGDHLHPDAAGQTAIADAVPPAVLGLESLPEVPALVPTAVTPGCKAL